MTDNTDTLPENLEWGHGDRILDVFLEPTCPHCARAFGKLKPLLETAGEDRLTIRIHMHQQPWHEFSSTITRAILAASATKGGKEAAYKVMDEVFQHKGEFSCEEHCKGPNMDVSPAEILRRISHYTGLDLSEAFERKDVTTLMKRQARFSRQNGVHVSPTFMIDGLINDKMSSRDEIEKWLVDLGLASA